MVEIEDQKLKDLKGCRLLKIEGRPVSVVARGPIYPGSVNDPLGTGGNPDSVAFMEWSNNLAQLFGKQGQQVACEFTALPSRNEVLPGNKDVKTTVVKLEVRHIFEQVGDLIFKLFSFVLRYVCLNKDTYYILRNCINLPPALDLLLIGMRFRRRQLPIFSST